jgi:predicted DNA-binding protein YlxM (UPF0122 family)
LSKDLSIVLLLDIYGELLTPKQRGFLEGYYNEDLSLSELAENEGITRQGVRDAIKRAEHTLFELEDGLGLAQRNANLRSGLEEILRCAKTVHEQNLKTNLSREINETVAQITAIAESLLES